MKIRFLTLVEISNTEGNNLISLSWIVKNRDKTLRAVLRPSKWLNLLNINLFLFEFHNTTSRVFNHSKGFCFRNFMNHKIFLEVTIFLDTIRFMSPLASCCTSKLIIPIFRILCMAGLKNRVLSKPWIYLVRFGVSCQYPRIWDFR